MALILLDSNVLSELMKPVPNETIQRWLDSVPPSHASISSITVAEIKLGLALLPDGKRKVLLAKLANDTINAFAGAVVSFDPLAAEHYASLVAARRKIGRPIETEDAQIAAIARSAGLTLATRNTGDFSDIENLKLVDPWQDTLSKP